MYLRGHNAWESCRFWKTVCCGLPRKMPCASNRCQALVQRCLGQRLRQALETTLFGPRKPCGALSMLDDAKRLALGSLCTRRRAGVPSHRQCTFFAGGPTRLRWRPCVLFCILTRARDVAPIPVDASAVRRTPSPKRARTRDTSGHTRRRRNPKHFVCHLWQCVAFVSVPL